MRSVLDWNTLEKLRPGQIVETVEWARLSVTQLAFYCAATGVTDPIHYDRDFAKQVGFPDIPANGSIRVAWVTESLSRLIASPNHVVWVKCSHRGPVFVGQQERVEIVFKSVDDETKQSRLATFDLTGKVEDKVVDIAQGAVRLRRPDVQASSR